jgi:hypothetical protein
MTPKGACGITTWSLQNRCVSREKPMGGKAPEVETGGRRRRPEKGSGSPRQYRLVDLIGPVRKSHGGAGGSHGTVRSRGAKPQEPRPSTLGLPLQVDSATMKLAAASGETAGGCDGRPKAFSPADESKTAKGNM